MASIVVKRKTAKRTIKVPRGTISRITYTPPKLPDKPKVDIGPHSFGRSRSGKYIVPRFYVSNWSTRRWEWVDRWWVIDCEEGNKAKGTNEHGYATKEEAIKIAEKYRDKYGAWALLPF